MDHVLVLAGLVAILAILAGCSGLPDGEPVDGDGPGAAGVTGTATGLATLSPVAPGISTTVTVVSVVDADTIDVRFSNGTSDTVRLVGIDVPETRAPSQPDEFEGVPNTTAGRECLRAAGAFATSEIVRPRLEGETVTLSRDPKADRRGDFDRRLAYVVSNGTNLNYQLLNRGFARVYDAPLSRFEAFERAESRSQAAERGLWSCRKPGGEPPWKRVPVDSERAALARPPIDAIAPEQGRPLGSEQASRPRKDAVGN